MKYCIPEDRPEMCPAFKKSKSMRIKYRSDYKIFFDGTCETIDYHDSNQRICQLDLSYAQI